MLSSKCSIWLIFVGLAVTAMLAGCGGGSNGAPVSPTTGSLEGQVKDFTSGLALQGVLVKVGPYQAETDANGNFLISNIPAGTYQLEIVPNPVSHLVLPPGSTPPTVSIYAGDTTTISDTIYLMDENDVPPPTP
jgi:hypothetical protein